MLADTDAGSIITAAQSGAEWGYRLLLLQFALVPILYIVQELTVRLGLVTGKGHAELIQQHFGAAWAWFSVATLMLSCVGALLSELSGLAGVGAMLGVPTAATMALVIGAAADHGLHPSISHGRAHRGRRRRLRAGVPAGRLAGAAERPGDRRRRDLDSGLRAPNYLYLVSANIGAVIMPWMVFFQQSSLVEKRLTPSDLASARLDTAIGALLTQLIMAAVLVAAAATIGKARRRTDARHRRGDRQARHAVSRRRPAAGCCSVWA